MEKLPEFIGNHTVLVSLLVAISLLLLWNFYGSVMSGIKQLSPMEVTRLMNHENAVLLDVRNNNDFKNFHILNSINFPDSEIQSRQDDLQKYKNQEIITYCEHGNVSEKVARSLKASGFEQVYCLKGGIGSWRNANLPLTKD